MLALAIFVALGLALALMVVRGQHADAHGKLLALVGLGFAVRPLLFLVVMRNVAFFSHGRAGGDCVLYEHLGSFIVRRWELSGVHFVLPSEMPQLGSTALVCNTLALLEYVGGSPQPLAGTIVNAFLACWMALMLHAFARDWGVEPKVAFGFAALALFSPAYLYHTSDTYKDGVNAFLVISSLTASMRLAKRFETMRVIQLVLSLVALWFVRHYMVFMCLVPLGMGVVGIADASVPRRVGAVVLLVALVGLMYVTGSADAMYDSAEVTFERATSENALAYNAHGTRSGSDSSGVIVDNFFVRLLYTVFAPFPWQFGSIGLQLGKIESFITYYYFWVVFRSRRWLMQRFKTEVWMLLSFLGPGLIAYSYSMSNVGLIVRQRMPLVIALGMLATLGYAGYRSRAAAAAATAPAPATPARPRRRLLAVR